MCIRDRDKGNQQMTEGDSLDNLAATADPAYERQVDALMEKLSLIHIYFPCGGRLPRGGLFCGTGKAPDAGRRRCRR